MTPGGPAPTVAVNLAGTVVSTGVYSGTVVATAATTAPAGVKSLTYCLDGAPAKAYTAGVPVTAAGTHTFTVTLVDSAGRSADRDPHVDHPRLAAGRARRPATVAARPAPRPPAASTPARSPRRSPQRRARPAHRVRDATPSTAAQPPPIRRPFQRLAPGPHVARGDGYRHCRNVGVGDRHLDPADEQRGRHHAPTASIAVAGTGSGNSFTGSAVVHRLRHRRRLRRGIDHLLARRRRTRDGERKQHVVQRHSVDRPHRDGDLQGLRRQHVAHRDPGPGTRPPAPHCRCS